MSPAQPAGSSERSILVRARLPYLSAQKIRVRVRGEGEPLLLINGMTRPLQSWDQLTRLLPGRTVISFDAPGVGGSPTPVVPLSITELATLAAEVLDAAGVPDADILGYSHGGAIAQELAINAPDRVRALILAATSFLAASGGLLTASPGRSRTRWACCGSHWRCRTGQASRSSARSALPRSWSAGAGTGLCPRPTAGSWPDVSPTPHW